MSEQQIGSILYDHYKDTCSSIGDAIKRRDRLMVYVILVLGFFAFQTVFPTTSDKVVNDFLNFKFGLTLSLDLSIIGNVVWFLLLIFSLRYFQVAVFVERQYVYLHGIEDSLNKELGTQAITRESKSYLNKYPLFSDWMWLLYTVGFPLLLLFVGIVKMIYELGELRNGRWTMSLVLDLVAFVLLAVSIILYLSMIHRKSKK